MSIGSFFSGIFNKVKHVAEDLPVVGDLVKKGEGEVSKLGNTFGDVVGRQSDNVAPTTDTTKKQDEKEDDSGMPQMGNMMQPKKEEGAKGEAAANAATDAAAEDAAAEEVAAMLV
jgi:hypothetical protein